MEEARRKMEEPDGPVVLLPSPFSPLDNLIQACEYAELTRRQTAAVVLRWAGCRTAEIAEELEVSEQCVADALLAGERKLREAHGDVLRRRKRWLADLFLVIRNGTIADWQVGQAEPPIQRRWRPDPERLPRPSPPGSRIEDLLGGTRGFLAALAEESHPPRGRRHRSRNAPVKRCMGDRCDSSSGGSRAA